MSRKALNREDTYLGQGSEEGGESDGGELHVDGVTGSGRWSVIRQRKDKE